MEKLLKNELLITVSQIYNAVAAFVTVAAALIAGIVLLVEYRRLRFA